MMRRLTPFITSLLTLVCVISPLAVTAQTTAPQITRTAEYDMGFDCPVAATFSPDQTTLWVLMDNCGNGDFTLHGFKVADGSPVEASADHFASSLTELEDQYLYAYYVPLAFTADGAIDILYNENEKSEAHNIRFSLTADQPPASNLTLLTNDTIQTLIPGYGGYPESTTYSTDHTLAIVVDTKTFHIIDLQAGKDIFQIEEPISTDHSSASFSSDNQHLYLTTGKNIDNPNDSASTLTVYSLPDGKLVKTYDLPSDWNIVSPNGRYVAGYVGGQYDAALLVTDLETGSISQLSPVNEPAHLVTECLNTKKNVSDVGFKATGELPMIDLIWLPDSSGFLTVNSYQGEAAGGGSLCIFNYSRLRTYKVQ